MEQVAGRETHLLLDAHESVVSRPKRLLQGLRDHIPVKDNSEQSEWCWPLDLPKCGQSFANCFAGSV